MVISCSLVGARRVLTTAAVALACSSAGASATATAAPLTPARPGNGHVSFTRQCPAPEPGRFTCFALRRTDVPAPAKGRLSPAAATGLRGYAPADLASAYGLPVQTAGAGTVVAIVDAFDNPNAEADLAVYRAQFGLPACTTGNGCFRKIDQRGGTGYPAPDAGWAGEIALDVDMVSAACPLCHILLVETDNNTTESLGSGVNEAVALGAKYVSNSYGGTEDASALDSDTRYYNHPGVAITASTGDSGYGVEYPSTSRFVTAVGGTTLTRSAGDRGWDETAWSGAGSGCSAYEPKPAFQKDTLCATRTVADVSAIADPVPGVTVYNTYFDQGWNAYGGTSASAPIVAAAYALAGRPGSADYPNSYPYTTPSALNDVVGGSNGLCEPLALCTGVSGYDGPTGLGTPQGTVAFAVPGPHGSISGTVTDAKTGRPIPGVRVSAATQSVTTDPAGRFLFVLPPGTYPLTVTGYGYLSATIPGVVVSDAATTVERIALTPSPHVTLSGRVVDGAGHGWPVYARLSLRDTPLPAVYSNPFTGAYRISVPANAQYVLDVAPQYGGYQPVSQPLAVAARNRTQDVRLAVDVVGCTAAGYAASSAGAPETFDARAKPAGWSVVDALPANTWTFDDPGALGNKTGGSGGFASVSFGGVTTGQQAPEDTTLISAPVDLTAVAQPTVSWHNDYAGSAGSTATVEYTVDGGTSWYQVWSETAAVYGPVTIERALPLAAHRSAVQVRFHFTSPVIPDDWQVDDVFIGQRYCRPVPAGLVAGLVSDANTGQGVVNSEVRRTDVATEQVVTVATPDDPRLPNGYYWTVSDALGTHAYAASRPGYVPTSHTVTTVADTVTRQDFSLAAGRVSIGVAQVAVTQPMGTARATQLTLTNTGTAPATVRVGEQAGGTTPLVRRAAPRIRVPGVYSGGRLPLRHGAPTALAPASSTASAWTPIANHPGPIADNAVGSFGGRVYSVGGINGANIVSSGNVFDPASGAWTAIAPLTTAREKPAAAFVNGRFYVAGGWGTDGTPVAASEVYDPARNEWTPFAPDPTPMAASGVAVLNAKMYVVGGCDASACGSSVVEVYDPATNRWSTVADYPQPTSWLACGAINGRLYCAGGLGPDGASAQTYGYDPATNAWSRDADLPVSIWGMVYTAAGNDLLLSTGVVNTSSATNEGFRYSPATDRWSLLPNATTPVYRAGGGCGFYRVGGGQSTDFAVVDTAELLPGFDSCGDAGDDVPWLSGLPRTVTLAAGATATIAVRSDARTIAQPGTYAAALDFTTSAPYPVTPVTVSMQATPPPTWGKIAGTVTGVRCAAGSPLAGATVEIDSDRGSWTLATDRLGRYQLWLDAANDPLQLIASQDGWQPQARSSAVTAGATTNENFALLSVHGC